MTVTQNALCLLVAATIALPAATAAADGFYFAESFGVSRPSDEGAQHMSDGLALRLAAGIRRRQWAAELWGGLINESSGAYESQPGYPDCLDCGYGPGYASNTGVAGVGIDVKYLVPLVPHVEAYVRGGLSHGYGTGTLEGYDGRGFGGGVGVQLKGKGSVLGLLWAPLFFSALRPQDDGRALRRHRLRFLSLESCG
ncbi:MAG: hypothetical protein V9G23_13920 [Giesbergeria sp.]